MKKWTSILGAGVASVVAAACTQTAGGPPPGMTAAQGAAYLREAYDSLQRICRRPRHVDGRRRPGRRSVRYRRPCRGGPVPGWQYRRGHSGAAAGTAQQQGRGTAAVRIRLHMTRFAGLILLPLLAAACTQTASGPPPGMTAAQASAYCSKLKLGLWRVCRQWSGRQRRRQR